ncbi:MAG: autotransporter domain-containing protein [Alphaproteobacteria bacterium]|nr:autotransporter domain-containing protein [Alphaproteobacteria bacterium]
MKKLYYVLLLSTCLTTEVFANESLSVLSYDALLNELASNTTANVVLDMKGNGLDLNYDTSKMLTIGGEQQVILKNIGTEGESAWTNSQLILQNAGTLTLEKIIFKNNDAQNLPKETPMLYNAYAKVDGAWKLGVIDRMSDFVFDNNNITVQGVMWGGLLSNKGIIHTIENGVFSNNTGETLSNAPHGSIILNMADFQKNPSYIGLINNVVFSNNIMSTNNTSGGMHGAVIENNRIATINKITNSKFIENGIRRTGTKTNTGAAGVGVSNYHIINEISDSLFKGNFIEITTEGVNAQGGAIYQIAGTYQIREVDAEMGTIGLLKNLQFIDNSIQVHSGYARGAAITQYSDSANPGRAPRIGAIQNNFFSKNHVISSGKFVQGGAIYTNGVIDEISNTIFSENYAISEMENAQGGAIAQEGDLKNNLVKVYMKNVQADFDKNYVKAGLSAEGGAIYLGEQSEIIGYLTGSFTDNKAIGSSDMATAFGGAIYNNGTIENIMDSEFIGNSASSNGEAKGGAIYNSGSLSFSGTNVFKNNKAGDNLNDIHNEGTISFSGNITLDGGISGTGTIIFETGALLTAEIDKTHIEADTIEFKGENKLNLVIEQEAQSKEYEFITAWLTGVQNVSINENIFYDLSLTDKGTISVLKRSDEDVQSILVSKMDSQSADMVMALQSLKDVGTQKEQEIASQISQMLQTNSFDKTKKALHDLAPTNSSVVMQLATSLNTLLTNVATSRVDSIGRSGGDVFKNSSLWIKALYNHAKESSSSSEGFSSNTKALIFGLDAQPSEKTTIGIGYAHTNTKVDAGARDIEADGNTFFLYGKYQPNRWSVDWMASYGKTDYTEDKYPLNMLLRSSYTVDTYMASLMTGYDFENGWTPQAGLRYLIVDQENYQDGIQKVKTGKDDILTAVVGAKYQKDFVYDNFVINSMIKAHATYDVIESDASSVVSFGNGASYVVQNEGLDRVGFEGGIKLGLVYSNMEVSLDYDARFKKDYQDHTGSLNLKYNF